MPETTVTQGTATLVRRLEGWRGDAALYSMAPPLDGEQFVIVSAVVAPYSGPETYIFPAQEDGTPKSFGEMDGSYRGGMSHKEALEGAGDGYALVRQDGVE